MNLKDRLLNLDDIDTSKYLIDPKSKNFVSKMKSYGKEFDEIIEGIEEKKLFTYICLMYDYESELRKMFPELPDRKRNAALIAGFEMVNGVFDDKVFDLLTGQSKKFNAMIVKYSSLSNSLDHVAYVTLEVLLYHHVSQALDDPKVKTHETVIKIRQEMDTLRQSLLGGNEVQEMKKALYEGAAATRLKITVEDKREIMKEKGIGDWSPYGEDYDVELPRYYNDELP